MRKVLVVSVLIAIGSLVSAAPIITEPVECTESQISQEVCFTIVLCIDECDTTLIEETNADCDVLPEGNASTLTASHLDRGPDPVCEWTVRDRADNVEITVTIDSSDGLPVELESFSVE